MMRIAKQTVCLLALSLAAACGGQNNGGQATGPTPTPGVTPTPPAPGQTGMAVSWSASGVQPSTISLFVVDATSTGWTCTTLPYLPTGAAVLNVQASMPVAGSATFNNVAPGGDYLVAAFGNMADGTRVSEACQGPIAVLSGQLTPVTLGLTSFTPTITGSYLVTQHFNLGLPPDVQTALITLELACGSLGDPQLCTVVDQVTQIVTNLDVVAKWTFNQTATGSWTGSVQWLSVQGYDVSAWNLVSGTFVASGAGAGLSYKNYDLTIQFGNLMLFIVQDVLGYNLGALGGPGAALVQAFASQYVGPLVFSGGGTVMDNAPQDGVADQIDGNLTGVLTVSGWSHDFSMAYVGTRSP